MLQSKDVKQVLASAGLADCQFTPTGTGMYNDSYYLNSSEKQFVLRIAPSDDVPKLFYEVDMMKSEPHIHRLVRQHTDLSVPKIICQDFSREIIDRDYLIMEFLPGSPGPFDHKELGRLTKQLHAIESGHYGYPDRKAPMGKNWPQIFKTYVELIFKDCLSCGVMNDQEHDGFLSIYARNWQAIEETSASLLHLDLWSQNILTQKGKITGILDFDRGLYGDPELEFAVLDTYGYSTPSFFAGYGQPRPSDEKAQSRRKLYLVYELIKYAFIRTARGNNIATGRTFVQDCWQILSDI